ncbi:unnamed protein product [Umbelopsis ramanniana]
MTIEKESTEAEVYAPYNPYELDDMSDAGSEAALSTTDSTTLGGVQKSRTDRFGMRFKPIVPTIRRISKSNISIKSDTAIKEEDRRNDFSLKKTQASSHIRRQDVITPNVTATGPFSQGPSLQRSVKGEAGIGPTISQDTLHDFPTESDFQTRSRAIYGDIQLPIDLADTPESNLMSNKVYASQEMETNGLIANESASQAGYGPKSSNNLGELGNVKNGSLMLIQMPSILPGFRPAGDQSIISQPPSPVREKDDYILDISEPETVYLGQSKQRSKAQPKKADKGKSKAKEESKKKGKENRRTSISSKGASAIDDRLRRKMSVTSLNTEEMESEKTAARRRPEIDISHLPDGQIGSLLVYKSGKVKLRIGGTIMDLEPGILANCLEDLVIVEPNDKPHACQLGSVQHKLVASPNLDELLKTRD